MTMGKMRAETVTNHDTILSADDSSLAQDASLLQGMDVRVARQAHLLTDQAVAG